jgi:hypothetical protein
MALPLAILAPGDFGHRIGPEHSYDVGGVQGLFVKADKSAPRDFAKHVLQRFSAVGLHPDLDA